MEDGSLAEVMAAAAALVEMVEAEADVVEEMVEVVEEAEGVARKGKEQVV